MKRGQTVALPRDRNAATVRTAPGREVSLTNLDKVFFPEVGLTKRDLLEHYLNVAPFLLPHIADRPMVMKRYPNGATGDFFFMKRAPEPRPKWIRTCAVDHGEGNVIDFPVIDDVAALLWVVNLGCIDLNPWYSRCDDLAHPDVLHFDLDPVDETTGFDNVCQAALAVRDGLVKLGLPCLAKTTGSRGIHVYVPIERGPTQQQVWAFAKAFAHAITPRHRSLLTVEYSKAARPKGHVLVDYNQNRWGATLASVYSVRPTPRASVSTPVEWKEVERGFAIDDFRIDNVLARLSKRGDLWAPMASDEGRLRLEPLLGG